MALSTLLSFKTSLNFSTLPLTFRLIPIISPSFSSSLSCCFSSQCRRRVEEPTSTPFFSPPSQFPPAPKKLPFTASTHGVTWQDPYRWMRNTDDPDFVEYLHQENFYAQAFMSETQTLQSTLLSEMKSRMPATISTPPERWGPWLYYEYVPDGKEYPVLCRRLDSKNNGWVKNLLHCVRGGFGREEVLLDWNQVAEQYGYVHVGTCRVSPDHNFLAYTLDTSGSEHFVLQIKDLKNECIIPKLQVDGVVSLAWAQDARTLFYTLSDENQRPYRVMCTKIGSNKVDDIVVFTESDSSFCVDITSTKDGKFITVNSNSRTSSEVCVIDATNPLYGLRRLRKRVSGVQYFLEHHYGMFYILTNAPLSGDKEWPSGGYYLARCPAEDILSANWQTVILATEDTSLQDMDIFYGHLVLFLNKKGSNHDFMNSVYRVVLSSPAMPDLVVDYDMARQIFSMVHQEEVKGVSGSVDSHSKVFAYKHLDAQIDEDRMDQKLELQRLKDFSDAYCCERKEIVSHDGVLVPLTILYCRKAWKKGESPGLLLGYGAYGEVLDKSWCTDRLSLLDRGWVLAFADVRGGGSGDSSWHKSGCGLHKRNSIHDFVSCGKYMVNEGFVHRDRLGAIGYSAGCLLVGAAINMHPDLFRAAILKVPFLDICNTLLDPSMPLTILDYEEFGNPQIKSELESIRSFSPYDNIPSAVCYPSVLVTASFHDSRVGVWEAAKWVARVRDSTCSGCSRSVILKTNMTGGHFGEGGRYSHCKETAYDYAFLMKVIGVSSNN